MAYYVAVTFGCPSKDCMPATYRTDERRAYQDARRAKGTGTCTAARVYECDTLTLARTASISEIRAGERCIYVE